MLLQKSVEQDQPAHTCNLILLYTLHRFIINPLPDMPILGSSNLAANTDIMSKTWTNGQQFSDRVENVVGKGEIAPYEQFLLFPQCFQKLSVVDASKRVSME